MSQPILVMEKTDLAKRSFLMEWLLFRFFLFQRYHFGSASYNMSRVMRKTPFCIIICETKVADQLHGKRVADQCLCFRFIDNTIPLLPINPKFQASSLVLWLLQPG